MKKRLSIIIFLAYALSSCISQGKIEPTYIPTDTPTPEASATSSPSKTPTETPSVTQTPFQETPTENIYVIPNGKFTFEVPDSVGQLYIETTDVSAYIDGDSGLYICFFDQAYNEPMSIHKMALLWIRTWKIQGGYDLLHGPSYPITIGGIEGIAMDVGGTMTKYDGSIDYYEGSIAVISHKAGTYFTAMGVVRVDGNPQEWDEYGKVVYQSILSTIEFDQSQP